ncbi:MAG: hypothetical protein JHD33_05015 [Chthoniobacterales bacterium]|nr:hypothetical protein [Chthoniobacterales bacterium]
MEQSGAQIFEKLALWKDTVARDGPGQMACDEALMQTTRFPVLRIFEWDGPWVSAGYFTAFEDAVRVRPGLPVCRRWTGGGIVVHDGDFTFSLAVPRAEQLATARPAEIYRRIHAALAGALAGHGVNAELAEAAARAPRECFAAAVESDVVAGGTKIAGGAQRRTRRGLLYQGSLQRLPAVSGAEFGQILASALAASVETWRSPAGFENEVGTLTAQKYASTDFLHGRRAATIATRTAVP